MKGLTLFIPRFLAGVVPGRCFNLHPVTHLSLKSDDSNFVQNSFGVLSVLWGKKNREQTDNDVTMASLCSDEYRKLLITAYFKITAASLFAFASFIESY